MQNTSLVPPYVRFAPSPTGNIHIGNIRTAIFNWLYAKHNGGKCFLRIEDTDRERSTSVAVAQIQNALDWLGLDIDEEIFYQSLHSLHHQKQADKLLTQGDAYTYAKGGGEQEAILFRLPWDTNRFPMLQEKDIISQDIHPAVPFKIYQGGVSFAHISRKGKPIPVTNCLAGYRHLELFTGEGKSVFKIEGEIEDILSGKKKYHFEDVCKIRYLRREVTFIDLVKGPLVKPLDTMRDFVIIRHDASPVFHLANVCDDILQGISHIIRGDDHIENSYRHVFLFHALGASVPRYAHLPMIVNHQGKPYSKRDGNAYIDDFRQQGYLPEAIFNYLTLLGWSPGNDREKLSREEIIERFTIERIQSSPAQMDKKKLLHINSQYMGELSEDEFLRPSLAWIKKQSWGKDVSQAYAEEVASLMKSRTKCFSDSIAWEYFFSDSIAYDDKLLRKYLAKPKMKEMLSFLREELIKEIDLSEIEIETRIHQTTDYFALKQGSLNLPLRVALTGTTIGAGLYEVMKVLGKKKVLLRLREAIVKLASLKLETS